MSTYAHALNAARNLGNLSAYVAGRSQWSKLDAAFATKEFHRLIGSPVAPRFSKLSQRNVS